jgi:hypothetical protein
MGGASVPEAPVNKDSQAVSGQDKVRGAPWSHGAMNPKPKSKRVHRAAQRQFGLRVACTPAA